MGAVSPPNNPCRAGTHYPVLPTFSGTIFTPWSSEAGFIPWEGRDNVLCLSESPASCVEGRNDDHSATTATTIQIDLIQMDDYPADSSAISPTFVFVSNLFRDVLLCKILISSNIRLLLVIQYLLDNYHNIYLDSWLLRNSQSVVVQPDNITIDIHDLDPAVTYDVRVMANNSIGQSEPSLVVRVTTGTIGW